MQDNQRLPVTPLCQHLGTLNELRGDAPPTVDRVNARENPRAHGVLASLQAADVQGSDGGAGQVHVFVRRVVCHLAGDERLVFQVSPNSFAQTANERQEHCTTTLVDKVDEAGDAFLRGRPGGKNEGHINLIHVDDAGVGSVTGGRRPGKDILQNCSPTEKLDLLSHQSGSGNVALNVLVVACVGVHRVHDGTNKVFEGLSRTWRPYRPPLRLFRDPSALDHAAAAFAVQYLRPNQNHLGDGFDLSGADHVAIR
mmetsp:Transcript_15769/g.28010  ORF Transcript_15769/g.28010 Transcript_15769/m.28010 type:complete len:254 (-) Transcript_15769:322-1083(-)